MLCRQATQTSDDEDSLPDLKCKRPLQTTDSRFSATLSSARGTPKASSALIAPVAKKKAPIRNCVSEAVWSKSQSLLAFNNAISDAMELESTDLDDSTFDDSTFDRTPHRPVATHQDGGTAQELRKTNELLGQLVQQMKKTERRVMPLEKRESMSSCSSSSTNSRGKRKDIPIAVKVSCLCESSWTEWGGGATSLSSPPFGKYFNGVI